MARPPKADAEATRRRILDAAVTLFAARGCGATSMRDIARVAGVSQACVHHYFGSKDGLYGACVDAAQREVEGLRSELWPQGPLPTDLHGLLERGLRSAFRFALEHRPAIRLNLRTVLDTGALEERWRENVLLPFLRDTSAILAPFSSLPEARLRLAVHSLQALLVRYALADPAELADVVGTGEDPLRAVEDHLVALAWPLLGLPG